MSKKKLFSCTQCSDCCKGFGGTYLTEFDVAAISRFVGVAPEKFKQSYCTASGRRLVLKQRSDGYCIFWDENCTIHAVKPRMCRKWPFIESVVTDPINWHIMAGMCPGMDDTADDKDIVAYVKEQLDLCSDEH